MNIPSPKGAHTYIDRGEYLIPIAKKYHRDPSNLCLKIAYSFFFKQGDDLEKRGWGGSNVPVMDTARMQNICYRRGLAPRVYAVEVINWRDHQAICQLQDYAGKGEGSNPELFKKIQLIVNEYGGFISDTSGGEGGTWNSAGGKWVGFKGIGWQDKTIYKNKIKTIAKKNEQATPEEFYEVANYFGRFNLDYSPNIGINFIPMLDVTER